MAGLAAICRVKFSGSRPESLAPLYPTAEEARITTAIVQAAAVVRDLNFAYLKAGKGAPVTARFGADGITIIDPLRFADGQAAAFRRIYDKPI